jgi:hypothetical protein
MGAKQTGTAQLPNQKKEPQNMSFHFASQLTMDFVEPTETHHPNKPIGSKQCQQVLSHLQSGKPITALEALRLYGIFRLASRIHDLKKAGLTIQSRDIQTENGKKIAQYYL